MNLEKTHIEQLVLAGALDLFFSGGQADKRPLCILHGLFGSGRNWASVARELEADFNCILVDQRNHGQSPHSPAHGLADLVADLERLRQKLQYEKISLLGHSMGGLVAMAYALLFPELVEDLIVDDIAPRVYNFKHTAELRALQIDLSDCTSRAQAEETLQPLVPDRLIRQFLLTNLERTGKGYHWRVNAAALASSSLISDFSWEGLPYASKALFIRGEFSEYFQPADSIIVRRYFPESKIETIAGGAHWIHFSHQKEFIKIIKDNIL